jgi:hypothetical protein
MMSYGFHESGMRGSRTPVLSCNILLFIVKFSHFFDHHWSSTGVHLIIDFKHSTAEAYRLNPLI